MKLINYKTYPFDKEKVRRYLLEELINNMTVPVLEDKTFSQQSSATAIYKVYMYRKHIIYARSGHNPIHEHILPLLIVFCHENQYKL